MRAMTRDAFVFQTEKALEEAGDKIDHGDQTAVEADFAALKESYNPAPEETTEAQVAKSKRQRKN